MEITRSIIAFLAYIAVIFGKSIIKKTNIVNFPLPVNEPGIVMDQGEVVWDFIELESTPNPTSNPNQIYITPKALDNPLEELPTTTDKAIIWNYLEKIRQEKQRRLLYTETIVKITNVLTCINDEYIEVEELRRVVLLDKKITTIINN